MSENKADIPGDANPEGQQPERLQDDAQSEPAALQAEGDGREGSEAAEIEAATGERTDAEKSGAANTNAGDVNESKASEVEPAATAAAPAKTGRGVAWLALLLALLAAAGSGYTAWEQWQGRDAARELAVLGESNHEQINTFQRSIDALENRLAGERKARNDESAALRREIQKANTQIEGQSRRLLSLTATTTDDWRLAEVEYLLRLANQRILTSKDGRTALNLLQAADEILVELGDPRLFDVRKAVANDRAALALVGQLDLDGVFLELSALASQVDKLPLIAQPAFSALDEPAGGDDTALQTGMASSTEGFLAKLREIATSTWSEIKSLVVIQRRDNSVKPLLPPQEQHYLRNNLRLLLNQAQLALLDGRQAPYSESLRSAVRLMQDYFPRQESANLRFAEQLNRLSEVVVAADYPDVSDSLIAIKAFIEEQHRMQAKPVGKRREESAAEAQP